MYDALDRFNRLIISRWVKNPPGGADRYKVTLSYDRNSNITEIDDAVQSGLDWQYTYDDLDRLTRARAGTLTGGSITSETRDQNWALDHAGNWGNTTFDLNADDVYTGGGEYDWDFTENKANEITGWDNQSPGGNVTPVYDAAGNMTDAKRDWQYEYDAWYRLVRVRAQNGSGGDIVAEFKYNGLGHRISARYPSGGETAPWFHFAYDERWRMVAMYEDDAATDVPTEQFWHHNAGPSGFGGSSYIDDVVLRDRATGAEGEGILDERVYYLQNWHHDVVALVDTSGAIVERANYDGYGMPIGTFSTNGNRRGYAGYEIDPVLAGHWHVRHRVLRSDLGVWTRRDPASESFDTGLYLYASTAPPNYNDAMGLQPDGVYALLHRSHAAACEGACEWYFWARLSVHPRCPLVMVQQVRNEVACDRCCMNPTSGWVRRSYWERIPVPEVAPREVGGGFWLRSARTDRGIWGAPHESYGVFYQAGEIRTFCRQDLPDSAFDHWDTQVPNGTGYALNEGDAQSLCFGLLVRSGNFDSIGTKPQWWDTVTPRAVGTRLMVYNWGCDCADDKAHNNVYCSDDKGDVPKGIRGE